MSYSTLNPVPSSDPRDFDDNVAVFDKLVNSSTASELDRRGVPRKTWHQIEIDADALVAPNVSSLASLTLSANKGLYATGAGALAMYDLSALGRTLGGIASQAAGRTALAAAASGANTDITSITGSAATLSSSRTITATGDGSWTVNFNGSANVTAALTLASVGTAGTYGTVTTDAKGRVTAGAVATPIANGGTGATTQATALTALLGASVVPVANGGMGVASNTAMITLPLNNSWAVVSPRRAVYRKVGDWVDIEVAISLGVATDGTVVATLPVGFRPPIQFSIPVSAAPATTPSSTIGVPRVVFNTDGTITCLNVTSGGGINFRTMFSLS